MKKLSDEQMVDREYKKWLKGPQMNGWLEVASRCLLLQRKQFLRLVQRQQGWRPDINRTMTTDKQCRWIDRDDLLKALKARGMR